MTTCREAGAENGAEVHVPPDAWSLQRAALFLGVSPRTLERYVARRMVPCIVYPPARVAPGMRGSKAMIVFDPAELAAWRDSRKVGRLARAG